MAAIYVALFITRPWEQLWPALGDWHFERLYAVAMIGTVLCTRGLRHIGASQTLAVGAFLGALTVSWAFAKDPSLCWEPYYTYLTLVVFFMVLVAIVRTPYELVFMVACYVATMWLYLAKSLWEFFVHGQHRYDQGVIRLVGIESTFGGPNALAMSIVVSMPMLVLLQRVRRDFCCEWPLRYEKWFKWGLWSYVVLALTSLTMTNSRSGMLGFVVFVLLMAFQRRNAAGKAYCLVGAIALLALLWCVLPAEIQGRLRTIWDPDAGPHNAQVSAEGRVEGFHAGMTMFRRFPLSGVGVGNFVDYRVKAVDGVPLQAHNLAGQLLGETGLCGAGGFLWLLWALVGNCRRVKAAANRNCSATSDTLRQFAVAAQASVVLLLFAGLFGHNLYRFNWLWLAAFGLVAADCQRRLSKEKRDLA